MRNYKERKTSARLRCRYRYLGHQTLQDSDAHEGIDYATFAGHEVFGKIRAVYLRGIQIVNHNEYIGKGTGRIIKLQSSLCYGYREKDNGQ